MAWITPIVNWIASNVLTPADMNRIEGNTQDLKDNKVDKVVGKGLSTEDYTTAEKTKLSGIETGAEVNNPISNNLTTTTTGMALDATQGKVINDNLVAHKADNAIHGRPVTSVILSNDDSVQVDIDLPPNLSNAFRVVVLLKSSATTANTYVEIKINNNTTLHSMMANLQGYPGYSYGSITVTPDGQYEKIKYGYANVGQSFIYQSIGGILTGLSDDLTKLSFIIGKDTFAKGCQFHIYEVK